MTLSFTPLLLKFKRPFTIAHGVRDSTPVVYTRIDHRGLLGYGEASLPPYLGTTQQDVMGFLKKAATMLNKFSDSFELELMIKEIDAIETGNTAAKAAIDIALHDLAGKIQKTSCHEMFGADKSKNLFTAYTIPIDTAEGIKQRIQEANDYKILKVKLGSENDKKIIEEIRKLTDKEIIVDANEGWKDKSFALDMAHWLAERKVLLIEQPLPKKLLNETAWLTSQSPIPIIADEAVQRFSDIEKIKGAYHGINIKLMKCTGLHEAHKMILQARKDNMKIMLGCMSESNCGTSAAAQLAPLVDWIDLDGPLLIKEDFFEGVTFSEGKIILNDLPGIGVNPVANLFS